MGARHALARMLGRCSVRGLSSATTVAFTPRPTTFGSLRSISSSACVRAASSKTGLLRPWSAHETAPLTKIVATIGPVSENLPVLQHVVNSGMRIMRINFSHATFEEAELRMTNLRKCHGAHGHTLGQNINTRAVMLDTKGPEIRMGRFKVSHENKRAKIQLTRGNEIELTVDENHPAKEYGDAEIVFVNYPGLITAVEPGASILLDDGNIRLTVKGRKGDSSIVCEIMNSGMIAERRSVSLPGAIIRLPALSEKDKVDIAFGVRHDIDFVALSFVRRPEDVHEARQFIAQEHAKHWPNKHPQPLIISKIESTEGLANFEKILDVTDGIMVARGDLGVDIPLNEVTLAQKLMVQRCRAVGKPVVVATQMLETMINNPRPTRAEVADVTNAVLDGADCVMLSGESANGSFPVESVAMMRSIIHSTETQLPLFSQIQPVNITKSPTRYEAVAAGAVELARQLGAKAILVATKNGTTARFLSKHQANVPVVCVCTEPKVARQLTVYRSLHPIIHSTPLPSTWAALQAEMLKQAGQMGFWKKGDDVVVVGRDENGLVIRTVRID
eukprot:c2928_g1_i1.p1 GENE.c2928_g1_i1~~c2928_g1_i1.p1  ORF type:complete len:560 (-),score=172.46 c2928_g1_i1:105-1784(-)